MTRRALAALLYVAIVGCSSSATAQRRDTLTPTQWREDLANLASQLERRHAALYHSVSKDTFQTRVDQLARGIPRMSREQIIVQLAQIVALVHDGHTELASLQPLSGFRRAPVVLNWLEGNLYVVAIDSPNVALLGARVDSVAHVSAEAAYRRVTTLLSRDNDEEFKHSGPAHLTSPEVLAGLGIAPMSDSITLRLTLADGGSKSHTAAAVRTADLPTLVNLHAVAPNGPPLYASQPTRFYWYRYLSDSKLLYVQINAIANQSGQPSLGDFAGEVFRVADRDVPNRLILDLRNNAGGNNRLNRSLVAALEQRPRFRQPGALYVITGRRTFSAAMDLVLDLQRPVAPVIVGEPSRGAPFSGGNRESFTLPNSRLVVDYSERLATEEFRAGVGRVLRVAIAAPPNISALRAGVDPALTAIQRAPR